MISLLHQIPNRRSRFLPTPAGHVVQRDRVRPPVLGTALLGVVALLGFSGCSYMSVPVLRSRAADSPPPIASATPDADGPDRTAAECEQLRSEIRANQQAVREAPTISTSPEIVAAAEAKADKRIDDTRSQKLRPLAPLPPAPGMPPGPGAANP
jgi:hypothetical protein